MGSGSAMGGGMFMGVLMMMGVILLIVVLVRAVGGGLRLRDSSHEERGRSPRVAETTAERILDERYARGELSTEEYHERLRVLGPPD